MTDRTEDVKFRADVAFLCWRCHAPMVNSILMNHFRLKPSISQLQYIQEKIQQLEVTIPLIPRQRITCSTCHNPHALKRLGKKQEDDKAPPGTS